MSDIKDPKLPQMYLPEGFRVLGTSCGIKHPPALDLGLVESGSPALTFGAFTRNSVKAPPVHFCLEQLKRNPHVSHVLVNSGIANACTGIQGEKNIFALKKFFEKKFRPDGNFLMCSTGMIGVQMPVAKIKTGINKLESMKGESNLISFSRSIMTTDTRTKNEYTTLKLGGKKIKITGFCKGAGMISPDMATMLAFVLTDLKLPADYSSRFKKAVDHSFNSISVDGDMSTNDTVLLMSNGSSGVNYSGLAKEEKARVDKAFAKLFTNLAKKIVRDGEGATKIIAIKIKNALSEMAARKIAATIANSPLVKTAFFGADPNWGRIIASIGSTALKINHHRVSIRLEGTTVYSRGAGRKFDESRLSEKLKNNEVSLVVDLGQGRFEWTFWTCDLTYEYIKINAEYHT